MDILLGKVGRYLLWKAGSLKEGSICQWIFPYTTVFFFFAASLAISSMYGAERHAFGHAMMDTGGLLSLHHPGHAEVAEISSDLEG